MTVIDVAELEPNALYDALRDIRDQLRGLADGEKTALGALGELQTRGRLQRFEDFLRSIAVQRAPRGAPSHLHRRRRRRVHACPRLGPQWQVCRAFVWCCCTSLFLYNLCSKPLHVTSPTIH